MEKEADRVGIEKLLTIGKDPRGFISFFQRLQSGDPTDERMRLLSTHPRHEDRIRSLENLIPKNQMYADWSVD
jgi:predicted Zn-dependent protease